MAQSYSEPGGPATPPTDSADRPHAPEIKPPSGPRRLGYILFNRETRSGRFFRALLRGLLLFVLLAGIGALAVYLLFYRPLDQQMRDTQARFAQTSAELAQAQEDLASARQMQAAAETRAEQDQERLATELTRVQILRTVSALKSAQTAIQAKDQAAAARALRTAETAAQQASSRLNRIDANASSTLEALFTLVLNGLARDMTTAAADLERLLSELSRLDNALK